MEAKTAQQLEQERWLVEGSQLPCVRQRAQQVCVSWALAVRGLMQWNSPSLSCQCCLELGGMCCGCVARALAVCAHCSEASGLPHGLRIAANCSDHLAAVNVSTCWLPVRRLALSLQGCASSGQMMLPARLLAVPFGSSLHSRSHCSYQVFLVTLFAGV